MIILDATTKSIQVVLGEAISSVDCDYTASYVDVTTTTFTPISGDGTTNGVTPVTIVAAPAGSTQRKIENITVYNADTITHTLTFSYNDNSTLRTLFKCTLLAGETVNFYQTKGWVTTNEGGLLKGGSLNMIAGSLVRPANFVLDAVSDTANATSQQFVATFLGNAPKASSSANVLFRVTGGASGITWAEVGIFKGTLPFPPPASVNLVGLGTADVSGVVNTTGIKNVAVTLSPSCAAGDPLWVVYNINATGAGTLRAYLVNNYTEGVIARLNSGGQPSTVTGGIELTTISNSVSFWFEVFFN